MYVSRRPHFEFDCKAAGFVNPMHVSIELPASHVVSMEFDVIGWLDGRRCTKSEAVHPAQEATLFLDGWRSGWLYVGNIRAKMVLSQLDLLISRASMLQSFKHH